MCAWAKMGVQSFLSPFMHVGVGHEIPFEAHTKSQIQQVHASLNLYSSDKSLKLFEMSEKLHSAMQNVLLNLIVIKMHSIGFFIWREELCGGHSKGRNTIC